jgi:hypothetical protein
MIYKPGRNNPDVTTHQVTEQSGYIIKEKYVSK